MDASFADIAVVVACTQGVLVLCADKPITLTPFTCPLFAGANGSFTIDGANGSFTIAGANGSFTIDALPPVGCWCFNAFVRRFVTGTSRFLRGCSTGNTRRLFLGSFDRAYEREDKTEKKYVISSPCSVCESHFAWLYVSHQMRISQINHVD